MLKRRVWGLKLMGFTDKEKIEIKNSFYSYFQTLREGMRAKGYRTDLH